MAKPHYSYDDDGAAEAKRFTAIALTESQGSPMFAVVTVAGNQLVETHYINPSSAHSAEVKQTLLKILEQALK